jgi:hypothetical protein
MALYDDPIAKMIPTILSQQRQATSGVDPDWTQLAMMYGFRPNPYQALGSEGQDEQRFLASLKSIMDQQYGAYGNRLQNLAPGNPMQALPNYMYNAFAGMTPLFASPAANNPATGVAPVGTDAMFNTGRYMPGPLPNNQSFLIRNYLNRISQGTEGPPNLGGAGVNAAAQTDQQTGSAINAATQPTPSPVTDIAGGNTVAQNPPQNVPASAPVQSVTNSNAAVNSTAAADLQRALRPAQSSAEEIPNPDYRETLNARGERVNVTPQNKPGTFAPDSRTAAAMAGSANVGQTLSNFGSSIDQLAAAIVSRLMGVAR